MAKGEFAVYLVLDIPIYRTRVLHFAAQVVSDT